MEREINFYKNIFKDEKINGSAAVGSADPFIIKSNGFYYLTFTCPKGITLLKSFDLIYWEKVNETGIVADDEFLINAYAPEINYDNGYYYLTCSPNGNGHFLYRSENIEGPYYRISDNIQELIDGSFFIDSDENRYFLRASESGITIKRFSGDSNNNDFKLFDQYYNFKSTSIGNWTEGPYLIKRYGYYYLTYTGTHFLSNAYRVDYASGKNLNETGLSFKNTVLLSTRKDFHSLGHSMTFRGPDLDSYYIAYHNREDSNERFLNISRLLFSRDGRMICNGVDIDNNVMFDRPTFETFIQNNNYISEKNFKLKNCSIEYNFKGENVYLLYSYVDEDNYSYCYLKEKSLIFEDVKNSKIIKTYQIEFKKSFNLNCLHTLLLQFKKGYINVYLDNVEYVYHHKFNLGNGKIGFKNNQLKNAYIAYSEYSDGDSDQNVLKVQDFYINNMVKKNQSYKTSVYIEQDGDYIFVLDGNRNKNVSMRIDGEEISYNDLGFKVYSLHKGIHSLEVKNISSNALVKKVLCKNDEMNLNHQEFINQSELFGRYLMLDSGLYFENDRNAILTKFDNYNYELSADLKLVGNPVDEDRFIGLIVNVQHYGKDNGFEGAYSLQGYMFTLNSKYVYIIEGNFYHSKVLKKIKLEQTNNNLKVRKIFNRIEFYLNERIIYLLKKENENIKGKCGIYMNHASGIFSNINLKQVNKEEIYEK